MSLKIGPIINLKLGSSCLSSTINRSFNLCRPFSSSSSIKLPKNLRNEHLSIRLSQSKLPSSHNNALSVLPSLRRIAVTFSSERQFSTSTRFKQEREPDGRKEREQQSLKETPDSPRSALSKGNERKEEGGLEEGAASSSAIPKAKVQFDPDPTLPLPLLQAIVEDIRTIPNLLTLARIASTPFLGYMILTHDMKSATVLLFFAGFTDLLDGYLARKWNSHTVFGSIADPAADKILMTTMVVCLAKGGLMPVPLAAIILGRDVALIISAFVIRFKSLPPPRTFSRYWDFTLPSASVHPTTLSKYNTFLQLLLVGALTVLPVCPTGLQEMVNGYPLDGFMWLVALTTIASGFSYLGGGGARQVANKTNVAGKMRDQLQKKLKDIGQKKD